MKYRTILADPPWPYSFSGTRADTTADDYPRMSIPEIAELPVGDLAEADSVLILWAIWNQLEGALSVMRAWDFKLVTGFPWIKTYEPPRISMFDELQYKPCWGMGAWVRGCSEPVLIGKRGKAQPPIKEYVGLIAERQVHSRKPDSIYQYAESLPGPYLELFARRKREGCHVFGNQVAESLALKLDAS